MKDMILLTQDERVKTSSDNEKKRPSESLTNSSECDDSKKTKVENETINEWKDGLICYAIGDGEVEDSSKALEE